MLDRRIKDIRKELSGVDGRLKKLSKFAKRAEKLGLAAGGYPPPDQFEIEQEQYEPAVNVPPEPQTHAPICRQTAPATTYPEQRVPSEAAGRKPTGDRDQITRDGRFATYLMSREFHSVRPLRYERHVQRNKAIAMVVVVILLIWWMIQMFL